MEAQSPNRWLTSDGGIIHKWRFYNGYLHFEQYFYTEHDQQARKGGSGGRTFAHAKVGSSINGPWTTLSSTETWTSFKSGALTYFVLWNDPWKVTLDKQGGTGGTAGPLEFEPPDKAHMPTVTKPSLSGWTFSGYVDSLSSSTPGLYTKADGTATTRYVEGDDAHGIINAPIGQNKTLYAAWTKTVTFNANGGTQGALKTLTALKGAPLGKVCTQVASTEADYPIRSLFKTSLTPTNWKPTRAGYTFAGFYSAASGGTQWIDANGNLKVATCPADTPSTLYAHWTANTYTVTFNSNSGSGGQTGTKTVTYGSAMPSISTTKPTRAGYTFQGWYDNASYAASGAKQYYTAACASARSWDKASNATLYAGWKGNTITLTWNSQGGSAVANTTQAYASDAKVKLPANPARTGYTFRGWFTAASGGVQVTTSTALPASNTTYYAHWAANTYTVTFDANSGSGGQTGTKTVTYGSAMPAISTTKPTRAGYTFQGWYDNASYAASGAKQYYTAACTSARSWDKVSGATLYAGWKGNDITIKWDANKQGAAFLWNNYPQSSVTLTVPYDGRPLAAAGMPTNWVYKPEGYTFAQWNTSPIGNGPPVFGSDLLPPSNTTYYAIWSANSYTINLEPGEGATVSPTSVRATYDADVTLPSPDARAGLVFLGWDTEPDGTGTCYQDGVVLPKANMATEGSITLYGQWAPAIRVDVPLEVTASVDVLDVEAQAPASGYIESRCGEPLRVAEVAFEALDGAAQLFGAGNVAQVQLQALAGENAAWQPDGVNATFAFPLDASAVESDPDRLAAFLMDTYGTHIPISYRFAIPEALLPTLEETTDPKPICSVAYTVALANTAS